LTPELGSPVIDCRSWNRVGGFGTGGAGVVMGPKGLFVPV